jgi:RNA polymerase sigma factor (TIGR02999 family)
MSNVTHILSQIESGDPSAAEQLLPLVYQELRKLAAAKLAYEKPGQTLQATALVHEAYLRLVDVEKAQKWDGRGHFFAAAAEAMRRILIENARRRSRAKRGGQWEQIEFDIANLQTRMKPDELLDLDEALREFEQHDPEKAKLVKLRYFAGMTIEQAAEILDISRVTAHRHWTYARAWLHDRIQKDSDKTPG